MSEQEKLPQKAKNFSEWYHEIIRKVVIDQRYPLQGFLAYRPLGYETFSNIIKILEELLAKTGHRKCYFPMLIPERLLKKEEHHIAGFSDEVFWVTNAGKTKMKERAALRPTSETVMYEVIRNWIRSWRDLPLKIHQSCSVFRYETKHTRPLIRDREILWNEAHTSHATPEDAAAQIEIGKKIYSELFDSIAIPVIWIDVVAGVFAGAESAVEPYTIYPDGRLLEMGSVNNLGQKFSRAFDIKFKTKDEKEEYVYQTCYGVSERTLSAVVALHGDDAGLVLPPNIAPIQAVIVPIIFKESREETLKVANELKDRIEKAGIRVVLDDKETSTPGEKFYFWEMQGVPIRIEIGPNDIKKGGAILVRRDTKKKIFVKEKDIVNEIKTSFAAITDDMKTRAKKYLEEKIKHAKSVADIKENLKKAIVSKFVWCGDLDCASTMEKQTDAVFVGKEHGLDARGRCAGCSKEGRFYGIIGKVY